jgi:hypothetical protein
MAGLFSCGFVSSLEFANLKRMPVFPKRKLNNPAWWYISWYAESHAACSSRGQTGKWRVLKKGAKTEALMVAPNRVLTGTRALVVAPSWALVVAPNWV